eukprot:1830525-Prymnesium_polylepis.1
MLAHQIFRAGSPRSRPSRARGQRIAYTRVHAKQAAWYRRLICSSLVDIYLVPVLGRAASRYRLMAQARPQPP